MLRGLHADASRTWWKEGLEVRKTKILVLSYFARQDINQFLFPTLFLVLRARFLDCGYVYL